MGGPDAPNADAEVTKAPTTYKQFLDGRASTAALGGMFRQQTGGTVTPKMRAAMLAAAQDRRKGRK
jgi:hypothetical protein